MKKPMKKKMSCDGDMDGKDVGKMSFGKKMAALRAKKHKKGKKSKKD